jgi:glutamate racemase
LADDTSTPRPPTGRRPIGVFDSGVGGLTVVRALRAALPGEDIVYLGDTARVPYGSKSPRTVERYSLACQKFLLDRGVKLVVIACNTASAFALDALREASPVPVIGAVEPGADAALATTVTGRIGVIGTLGTVRSGAYERAIAARRPDAHVTAMACPLLVPLAEEGWFEHPATRLVAAEYLAPLQAAGIGTLVLGCTHYPLLAPLLADIMGPSVKLIDSGTETARALAEILDQEAPGPATHRFAVSDDPERFARVGARFLGERLGRAEVVTLESA